MFGSVVTSEDTSNLGEVLSSCMKIDSVKGNNIYLRNCGSGTIRGSALGIYIDEVPYNFSMNPSSIGKGEFGVINLYNIQNLNLGNHELRIVSSSGEVKRYVKTVYSSHLFSDEILYFNFDEGSGNKTYDLSPYHSNGDINASGRNQVKNPSFEMDKQYWDNECDEFCENWTIVNDIKYHGIKSSKFQDLVGSDEYDYTGYVNIPVTPDESITISAYSKGDNIQLGNEEWHKAYLIGRWINSTDNDLCEDSTIKCPEPYSPYPDLCIGGNNHPWSDCGLGTWNWERTDTTYMVPPGAVYYRFSLGLAGDSTGTLWVDAVQVEYGDVTTDFKASPWVSENSYDYVCSSANEYDDITVSCPNGKVIDSIENSVYTDKNSPASCLNPNPSGFCPSPCIYPCNCTYPYENCIGKNSCSFEVNNGNCPPDPCPGYDKKLILNVKCKYWAESKFGNALEFDGKDDYVEVNNVPINTLPGANNTVTFWMYWNGGYHDGWSMPFSWDSQYDIGFNDNGYFGFNTYNSDVWGISSSGLSNRWVYVTAIFYNGDAKNSRLFIDGIEQTLSQKQGSTGSSSVSNSARIGSGSDSSNYFFDGFIDEVRVWNRSLSQDEIRAITPVGLTLGELT
jgi:hypothetical protein